MFKDNQEYLNYIAENYPDVTDHRLDGYHWDIYCSECKIVRGFQVDIRGHDTRGGAYRSDIDWDSPERIFFRCPVCKAYKLWVVQRVYFEETEETESEYKYFRISEMPGEGIEGIESLPENPAALRKAYKEAIKSKNAGAYIAAAAMFRRALQVITRNILEATPSSLANELSAVVGKKYNGITITNDFSDNGYIIKEAGNQGAHPDENPDLLDFDEGDSDDLQAIFMEIVSDLFIAPEAARKAKAEFLARRKIRVGAGQA